MWFPVSFAGGAALYFSLSAEPGPGSYVLALFFSGLIAIFLHFLKGEWNNLAQFSILIFVWVLIGFGYANLRTNLKQASPVPGKLEKVMVEGWIERVETSHERSRLTIKVHAIGGVEKSLLPDRVRLTQKKQSSLAAGRYVRCFAQINEPPEPQLSGGYEFHRDAFFRGLGGVGFVYGQCKPGVLQAPSNVSEQFIVNVNNARQRIAAYIVLHAGEAGGGLAAALLTGDRSYLKESDQETLRRSGLAHLLAISGLHMGLAGGAFYMIFFRLLSLVEPLAKRIAVQKPAAIAALLGITAYLFLSGASISAQRAYIMVATGFFALVFDRPVLSLQTIGFALCVVILLSPSAVVTPGFQMSFAAAASLIKAFSWTQRVKAFGGKGVLQRYVVPILLTSVVAGLATTPFAIFHFERAAPLGIPANFIVMPVVTFVCVPLAVLSAFGMIIGVGEIPLQWFGSSLALVLEMADFFAGYDGVDHVFLERPLPVIGFSVVCFGLVYWIMSRSILPRISVLSVVLAVCLWGLSPTLLVVSSPTGHIAVNSNAGWQVISWKKGDLKPLAFADMAESACKAPCKVDLKGVPAVLSMNGSEFFVERADKTYPLDPKKGLAVVQTRQSLKTIDYSFKKCRPWNSAWPNCAT